MDILTAVQVQQDVPTVQRASMADKFLKDMQAIKDRHAKGTEDVRRSRTHTIMEECVSRSIGIGTDLQIGVDISLTMSPLVRNDEYPKK